MDNVTRLEGVKRILWYRRLWLLAALLLMGCAAQPNARMVTVDICSPTPMMNLNLVRPRQAYSPDDFPLEYLANPRSNPACQAYKFYQCDPRSLW